MATKREQVLQALEARLATIVGPTVKRNDALPVAAPPGGLINLLDGDPGDPEVLLSPLLYLWQHQAEIEVVVQKGAAAARIAILDDLLAAIGTALGQDRTLGGLIDWLEPGPPAPVDKEIEGAAAIRGASITVTLHYASDGPLA